MCPGNLPDISPAYSPGCLSTSRPAYKVGTAMEDTSSTGGQQKHTCSTQLLVNTGAYETRAEAVEDSYFQLGGSFLTRCTGPKERVSTCWGLQQDEGGRRWQHAKQTSGALTGPCTAGHQGDAAGPSCTTQGQKA